MSEQLWCIWPVYPHLYADLVHACDGYLPVNEANLSTKWLSSVRYVCCVCVCVCMGTKKKRRSREEIVLVKMVNNSVWMAAAHGFLEGGRHVRPCSQGRPWYRNSTLTGKHQIFTAKTLLCRGRLDLVPAGHEPAGSAQFTTITWNFNCCGECENHRGGRTGNIWNH